MGQLHPPRATRAILEKLDAQHPGADTELHYTTAFELLVATILSAQSTDQRVNLVTPAMFAKYPDARALAAAPPADVERLIVQTGFFRQKTKAIIGMSRALLDQHGGEVPASMEALVKLPGRRPQDRERRAGPRARRAGPPRGSACAPCVEPDRYRRRRRSGGRGNAAVRGAAARAVDAGV